MKTFETNVERDGLTFLVQGWEPDSAPKAVLVLVHGLGDHVARFAHVGQALTQGGYALIGFDLRGHGRSGGARGHFPALDSVLADIGRFREFVAGRYPGLPVFLYGHSLGGLLSLTYALQHPDAGFKGVVTTGAALRSSLQEQKAKIAMAKVLGSLLPATTIPSGLDAQFISHDQAVVEKYVKDPLVHDKASLGLGKAALTAIDLCFARATEFAYPLLIMHGKADALTYPSGSEDFAKLAGRKNQDITLKLWDGMYHEIHNEPGQAEVFKTMVAWLDGHVG